jgi:hypothetical protein
MGKRAETIWTIYENLRRDVMVSERCSALCNETLVSFVNATANDVAGRELPATADSLRYASDEALYDADRAIERAVTGMS